MALLVQRGEARIFVPVRNWADPVHVRGSTGFNSTRGRPHDPRDVIIRNGTI